MAPAIFRPIAKAVNKAIEMCCVSCPTGSTTDENGIISRFDITVCFCDTPDDRSENPYESGVTITVNGTPWTVDSAQPKAGTDCVTFTGLEPLSYGDVILFNFDYSASTWVSPTEDIVNLVITNYIGAPVQLLNLPSFNAVTGRLDPGDFYNARTATNLTIVNSDGYVETIKNARLAYEGSRVVQNLGAIVSGWKSEDLTSFPWQTDGGTPTVTATTITFNAVWNAWKLPLSNVDIGDPIGRTFFFRVKISGVEGETVSLHLYRDGAGTSEGAIKQITISSTPKTYAISHTFVNTQTAIKGVFIKSADTSDTVTTITVLETQIEDVTAKSVQDAPGEYESVDVGDELIDEQGAVYWTAYGTNLIEDDGDAVKITYVDDSLGGYIYLRQADGLSVDVEVGKTYILTAKAKINTSAANVNVYNGLSNNLYAVSSPTYIDIIIQWEAKSTIPYLTFTNLNAGEIIWIKDISLKEATTGYGIYNRANGNTVDANGVVTDTPGAVLAIAPVLRHAPAATNISNKDTEALSVWAGAATVNANTDVAPNGATTADTVTDPGAGWYERYIPSMACAGSTDYAASIFIKKTTSASSFPGISLNVIGGSIADAKATCNTDTGAITPRTGFIPDDYGVEDVGDYWRFWVMHNSTTGTALTFLLYPAVNADASATWTDTVGGSVVAWGGQVEAGSVPTPYIYTNGGGASRTIDQILHPWSESVLSQAQGSIVLKIKIKAGTYTPASDVGLVTIYTALNNILYLNSGDAISAESADGTNTVNSGVVAQSADDELGIYVSWANSTIYPAAGNISVGLKNLTTPSAWSESTGNYDGGYPETASILRLLSGLTCEATIEDFVVYNEYQTPTVLKGIIDA